MAQPIRHCLSACVTFSTRQRAPGCVLEPNKSHSVATLHAPPGSSQGASTERFGFQAPLPQGGLHRTSREPSSLRSSPAHCPGFLCAPSLPLQTPAAQHVLPRPQCTLLPPISCCRETAGAGGLGSGVAWQSAADLGII